MPVNIVDSDSFTDPVTAPDDGDPANGATFQAAPQALANRTRNLKNRVDALYGNDPVALEGVLELDGQNVEIEQSLTVGGDVTVSDDLTVTDDVTIGGDAAITGAMSADSATIETLTVTGEMSGKTRFRVQAGLDSAMTINDGHGNFVITTSLSGSRTYTVSNVGRADGDWHWFVNYGGGDDILVTDGTLSKTVGNGQQLLIVYYNSAWKIVAFGSTGI